MSNSIREWLIYFLIKFHFLPKSNEESRISSSKLNQLRPPDRNFRRPYFYLKIQFLQMNWSQEVKVEVEVNQKTDKKTQFNYSINVIPSKSLECYFKKVSDGYYKEKTGSKLSKFITFLQEVLVEIIKVHFIHQRRFKGCLNLIYKYFLLFYHRVI